MIKAVLFDLDGTVADTNNLIFQSFRYTLAHHGIHGICDEDIYSHFGEPLYRTMERYSPDHAQELVATYHAFNLEKHDEMIRPFPGIRETLSELQGQGLSLGIVTSKRLKVAKRSLEVLDLTSWFQAIVTPEDTEKHKPDPAPVLFGAQMLRVLPGEAMMVGDSPYDLIAGRRAGCLTCGVEYTKLALKILLETNPDYMIARPEDLPEIVARINENDGLVKWDR